MTRCLETRRTPEGFKRRRYETDEGLRFSTIEVPLVVWKGLVGRRRVAARTEQWRRGQDMAARKARGLQLHAEGWKPEAIASEIRVTTRTVQRWVKP